MSSGVEEAPHPSAAPDVSQNHRKHPCVLCQQRKVKCDRNDPCANCTKARVECISPAKLPQKRRKKRFPEAELLARLRKYEEHLRRYGADIDAINQEETPIPTKAPERVITKGPPGWRSLSVRRSLRKVESNVWNDLNHEFHDVEEMLQDSSDDEFEDVITRTYDEISSEAGNFLLQGRLDEDLTPLHPSPVHIFRLWQTFLDNISPLIKIFHAPTIQQQILGASADLKGASIKVQALMFGIYSMAITSLSEEECRAMLEGEKQTLLRQYHSGARQALTQAGFLRTSDMTMLQGYVLYLYSCHNISLDPRDLFCLTAIAIRIAQRMGLNFDGTNYGLLPFEIEMRRRLWWQILFLDSRAGELSGVGPSILQHSWTTRLPSNVNDSDLSPDMRGPIVEHPGATEMIFVLPRCEVGQFQQQFKTGIGLPGIDEKTLNEFEQRLEQKYLKYCDPQIPVHLMSRLMARMAVAKLRVGALYPHLMSVRVIHLSQAEKDKAFILSLRQVESHQIMIRSKSLGRFEWFIRKNFPLPAYIVLLCSLRQRTSDALADEAWKTLEGGFENSPIGPGPKAKFGGKSTLQLAIANLTIKAWEAREAACRPVQPMFQTPQFILRLKQELASRGSSSSTSTSQSTYSPPEETSAASESFDVAYSWATQAPVNATPSFDETTMPLDPNSSSWEFWGDYMQVPGIAPNFDGSATYGYYQN